MARWHGRRMPSRSVSRGAFACGSGMVPNHALRDQAGRTTRGRQTSRGGCRRSRGPCTGRTRRPEGGDQSNCEAVSLRGLRRQARAGMARAHRACAGTGMTDQGQHQTPWRRALHWRTPDWCHEAGVYWESWSLNGEVCLKGLDPRPSLAAPDWQAASPGSCARWHALWRLPPAMKSGAPGLEPWMRYPAGSPSWRPCGRSGWQGDARRGRVSVPSAVRARAISSSPRLPDRIPVTAVCGNPERFASSAWVSLRRSISRKTAEISRAFMTASRALPLEMFSFLASCPPADVGFLIANPPRCVFAPGKRFFAALLGSAS